MHIEKKKSPQGWEIRNYKNRHSVGGSVPEPPLASSSWGAPTLLLLPTITNFVKFVSCQCVYLLSKKNKITTVNVLLLFLPRFLLQTL